MTALGPDCVKTKNILDFKNSAPKHMWFSTNNQESSPLKNYY